MKRFVLFISIVIVSFASCKTEPKEEVKKEVETISDAERLEGKVVMSTSGEWFVIKDGMRWRAMSEPATTDYLKSIEDGNNHVEKNISQQILDQFPIAGEILPNVEFKKDVVK